MPLGHIAYGHRVGRAESEKNIPRAVATSCAAAANANAAAFGHTSKLVRHQRSISCNNSNNRSSLVVSGEDAVVQVLTDRYSQESEISQPALVGLYQNANGELSSLTTDTP